MAQEDPKRKFTPESEHYLQLFVKEQSELYINEKIQRVARVLKYISLFVIPLLGIFGYRQYLSIEKFNQLQDKLEIAKKEVNLAVEKIKVESAKINEIIQTSEEKLKQSDEILEKSIENYKYSTSVFTEMHRQVSEISMDTQEVEIMRNKIEKAREEIMPYINRLEKIWADVNRKTQQIELTKNEVSATKDSIKEKSAFIDEIYTKVLGNEKDINSVEKINKILFKVMSSRTFVLRRDQISYEIKLPDIDTQDTEKLYIFQFGIDAIEKESHLRCTYYLPDSSEKKTTGWLIYAPRKREQLKYQRHQIGEKGYETPYDIMVDYINDDFFGNDFVVLRILPNKEPW
jgi:DNA repair exonuclease SbcCD ATPase subunit